MKWIRLCGTVLAMFGLTTVAQAGVFNLFGHHGSQKGCGCAEQPSCCAPAKPEHCAPMIARPCETKTYTYQRQVSCLKPPCCQKACAPTSCCAPSAKTCCPTKPECCAPAQPACGNQPNCETKKHHGLFDCFKGAKGGLFGCHDKKGCGEAACGEQVCGEKVRVCDADPCEIAELIYASQTACQPKDRKKAVDDLGDFDCVCYPEILCALVYALNDCDPGVRKEAADEIGDVLSRNRCCCKPEVTSALTCALADCDKDVRKQAEEALEACGYRVVDGCCQTACGQVSGCTSNGCTNSFAPSPRVAPTTTPVPTAPAPIPEADGDDAPPPPADLQTYFPSRLHQPVSGVQAPGAHRTASPLSAAR